MRDDIKGEKNVLNNSEVELIEYMDYQVLNNGIAGWLGNKGYEKVFDFIEILNKRNSELDKIVISIFQRATISGLGYYLHKDSALIPEIKEIVDEYEKDIEECKKQYSDIASAFMDSYGLKDYLTKFTENMDL